MKRKNLLLVLSFFLVFSCSRDNYREMGGDESEIPAEAMHELETEEDLDVLLNEIGDSQIVLLGEASHGTSEFYTWRDEISRRLIDEKGFKIIAVEGDWADAYPLNAYIKGNSSHTTAEMALQGFDRWPQWMWKNEEIAVLAEWLESYNLGKSANEKVGFYGIDVYGLWESLQTVHLYLQRVDPSAAEVSQAVLDCFAPYDQDEFSYARSTLGSSDNCADEIAELIQVVQNTLEETDAPTEVAFNILQNALVVEGAEKYYRTAVVSNAQSWNVRDIYMAETIKRLLQYHGTETKIIVWEHNTHVGDARATDMADAGMVNVGQLVREDFGSDNVFITGFGTYKGNVIAAERWGSRSQIMDVPKARRNSWEWRLHRQGPADKIIFMEELGENPFYQARIGHRAIGVVYNPEAESGNYVPSVLPDRYDAFIFIDETHALQPIE